MAAWITEHTRSDGVISCYVRWRTGGVAGGKREVETFAKRTTKLNRTGAAAFKKLVDEAGQNWPDGWIKGVGWAEPDEAAPIPAPVPTFSEVAREHVDAKLDITPGVRKTYRGQISRLAAFYVGDYYPFDQPIDKITRDDVVLWRRNCGYSLKTQSNYHMVIWGTLTYAVLKGLIPTHPALDTAPSAKRIKAQQGEKRFLTEAEFATAVGLAGGSDADFMTVLGATGMRFSEATAMWVSDVNLFKRTIRITKAWKREGDEGEQDVPPWLAKLITDKHRLRGYYLGEPKSEAGRRTISIPPGLVEVLRPYVEGRAPDDVVFTRDDGKPIHGDDYSHGPWARMLARCAQVGIEHFTPHDLRHSHVGWLMAGGVDLPVIQRRLGHADFNITNNTYGHLLPQHTEHVDEAMEAVLGGRQIRNRKRKLRAVAIGE